MANKINPNREKSSSTGPPTNVPNLVKKTPSIWKNPVFISSLAGNVVLGILLIIQAFVPIVFPERPAPISMGRIVVNDIIVLHDWDKGLCSIDFRVTNVGDTITSISRVRFEVVDIEIKTEEPSFRLHDPISMEYDLDISDLNAQGDVIECIVSQAVEPNGTDRFAIILSANEMFWANPFEFRRWRLKPYLITSNGEVSTDPIEVALPL